MKLLLILMISFKILLANDVIDFKSKTEKNRALILKQYTSSEFAIFEGNPWFEDEQLSKELLSKSLDTACYIKNEKVLNDKNNFINMHISVYECTGESIRSDKDILLAFEKQDLSNYQPFQYASQSLKKDKAFVLILLDRGVNVYPYIDKSLKDDEEIIQKSMKLSVLNYEYLPKKFRKDKELTIQAVKVNTDVLKYADESLKDDIEVIYAGLEAHTYPYAIEYASNRLKDNIEVMLKATQIYARVVKYASKRLKDNKAFMLKVIENDPTVLKYASKRLRKIKK